MNCSEERIADCLAGTFQISGGGGGEEMGADLSVEPHASIITDPVLGAENGESYEEKDTYKSTSNALAAFGLDDDDDDEEEGEWGDKAKRPNSAPAEAPAEAEAAAEEEAPAEATVEPATATEEEVVAPAEPAVKEASGQEEEET